MFTWAVHTLRFVKICAARKTIFRPGPLSHKASCVVLKFLTLVDTELEAFPIQPNGIRRQCNISKTFAPQSRNFYLLLSCPSRKKGRGTMGSSGFLFQAAYPKN